MLKNSGKRNVLQGIFEILMLLDNEIPVILTEVKFSANDSLHLLKIQTKYTVNFEDGQAFEYQMQATILQLMMKRRFNTFTFMY